MAKKRAKKIYQYECTLSGKKFNRTEKAEHPENLVSVEAYYEMNPEEEDRPEHIKKEIEMKKAQEKDLASMFESTDSAESEDEE